MWDGRGVGKLRVASRQHCWAVPAPRPQLSLLGTAWEDPHVALVPCLPLKQTPHTAHTYRAADAHIARPG